MIQFNIYLFTSKQIMNCTINKFIVRIDIDNGSYLIGEFICSSKVNIYLKNAYFSFDQNTLVPKISLCINDIISVIRLTEDSYNLYIDKMRKKIFLYSHLKGNRKKQCKTSKKLHFFFNTEDS